MNIILKKLNNRNTILVVALLLGFSLGDYAKLLQPYTIFILGLVMTFSLTGLHTKDFFPLKEVINPIITGTILNYLVFGISVITSAYFLIPDKDIFIGFVVIVASPPGVAIIPFSHIVKGNIKYSILGVFGAFLAAVFLAPIIIKTFSGNDSVKALDIFILMFKVIIVPLLLSRLLLMPKTVTTVEKIRGRIVDYGFALIIFTAVGLNRNVFFSDIETVLKVSAVLVISTFGIGWLFKKIAKLFKIPDSIRHPQTLLLTIKSSGFSVVTAFQLFGKKAAIPSAVLAVIVLLYLLYFIFIEERTQRH